jgi:molybdenum-dependent DNA-binding transcriptional regulator ModE
MIGNAMLPNLDVDLLKTFAVLAETGNFTRTAEEVGRTQSAVSMQVKRLEDLVGKPLLTREGRSNTLTADGQMLLDYARRMIQLNDEAMTVFTRPEVSGHVRFGTPDDYADRILPDVLARFARTNCKVQVDVDCQPSRTLIEKEDGRSRPCSDHLRDGRAQRSGGALRAPFVGYLRPAFGAPVRGAAGSVLAIWLRLAADGHRGAGGNGA